MLQKFEDSNALEVGKGQNRVKKIYLHLDLNLLSFQDTPDDRLPGCLLRRYLRDLVASVLV